MYDWFAGLKLRHFWEPITASSTAEWRRTHILAHILGGMVWLFVQQGFAVALGDAHPLAWHPVLRIALVGLWQAVGWEWTQHENWRPELLTPPGAPGTGYPWLSGLWDTIFAVVGASACLILFFLLRSVV